MSQYCSSLLLLSKVDVDATLRLVNHVIWRHINQSIAGASEPPGWKEGMMEPLGKEGAHK
jgi:hypothetical protein